MKRGYGQYGLWVALTISQSIHVLILVILSKTLDWKRYVKGRSKPLLCMNREDEEMGN